MSKSNTVSLHAQGLPDEAGQNDAPEWVHLLPTSVGAVATGDRRGPYNVKDAQAIITASLQGEALMPIDENHATDLAARDGRPSPARGWITALQVRDDGIWGKVDWTDVGRKLVESRAYRALSPVILHDPAKNILRILRASLINKPNLRGLTALNQENDDMSFMATLAAQLGLNADASEADITGGITALQESATSTALQSQLSEIGVALGLEADGEAADILAAASAKGSEGGDEAFVALQAEFTQFAKEVNAERKGRSQKDAEAFVDGAIKEGRVGVRPQRDRYIAMHMKDVDEAEALIGAMPVLNGASGLTDLPPASKDGEIALNADQSAIATMLGVSAEDYTKTLKAEEARQ